MLGQHEASCVARGCQSVQYGIKRERLIAKAASIKILVVDDQQAIRALVRKGLIQLGFSDIEEAPDGEAALKHMLASPAQLVISDFNMPKLDGVELLRAIRGHPPISTTAFIMLTGRADTELLQRSMKHGVNNFLLKPFTVATLQKKIEAVSVFA